MGRHRRDTPTPPPTTAPGPHDTGAAGARHRAARAHGRGAAPVRTGLLGASAAMAMGAVAVASGLVPGPGDLGSGPEDGRVQADGPSGLVPGTTPSVAVPDRTGDPATGHDEERSGPSAAPPSPSRPGTGPSQRPEAPAATPSSRHTDDEDASRGSAEPARESPAQDRADRGGHGGAPRGSDGTADPESAAEEQVLTLVNQERAKAGCRPVRADDELGDLASDFSEDMARRGFFSHTAPDGRSPWDRAEDAGVTDLGGENIARGQANAQSVMDSWMKSPGHRANILNCDYRTLGVGAHFAEGGPWWTQDFGF
ncbi:CAP domain-containing protein [Streptomyces sp. NRRL S-1868]|uniref:CAP domain-containing protein n=1 Tax=Streptomyces sp. NRRL S-1868 TaxID=1463892 RepID=UPI0004CBD7F9|nr:CAP domain-containing protein [Streptomyces sp. NRRL S-1868]